MLYRLIKQMALGFRPGRRDGDLVENLEAGKAAHRAGMYAAAETHYRKALVLQPEHAETLFHLGACCHAQKRLDEALRYCHEAYDSQPSQAVWRESTKNIANDIGKNEGVPLCEGWVAALGDFSSYLGLGNALRDIGRLSEARDAYERARALKPDSPFVSRRLGSLLALLGEIGDADACFRESSNAGLRPDGVMHMSDQYFRELDQNRAALLSGIVAIEGEWRRTDAELVVFLGGDTRYVRMFAYTLINSIQKNGGLQCAFHLHVVNPDNEIVEDVEKMRRALGARINYTWEFPQLSQGVDLRTYYACARFLQLPKLLEEYQCPLLLLDLDQIVIGDLRRAGEAVGGCDIGIVQWHPTKWDPWDTFSASAIWYQPTCSARELAQWTALYIAECLSRGNSQWFLDQCAIFCVETWLRIKRKPPILARFAPEWACLAGKMGTNEIPSETIFWTIIYSLDENHGAVMDPRFQKYSFSN